MSSLLVIVSLNSPLSSLSLFVVSCVNSSHSSTFSFIPKIVCYFQQETFRIIRYYICSSACYSWMWTVLWSPSEIDCLQPLMLPGVTDALSMCILQTRTLLKSLLLYVYNLWCGREAMKKLIGAWKRMRNHLFLAEVLSFVISYCSIVSWSFLLISSSCGVQNKTGIFLLFEGSQLWILFFCLVVLLSFTSGYHVFHGSKENVFRCGLRLLYAVLQRVGDKIFLILHLIFWT